MDIHRKKLLPLKTKTKIEKSERATCHSIPFSEFAYPFSLLVKQKIPCESHEPNSF